jgi:hypothetical protein
MRDICREFDLDSRITNVDNTDAAMLLANKGVKTDDVGFDFDTIDETPDDEVDIDNI